MGLLTCVTSIWEAMHIRPPKDLYRRLLSLLGVLLERKHLMVLGHPPFFLLCNETTMDVAIKKELIIYARYLSGDRLIHTSFIGLVEVPNGSANAILSALRKLCEEEDLYIDNKL